MADHNQRYAALLKEIGSVAQAGDLLRAGALAEEALARGPGQPWLVNLVAFRCLESGEIERAVDLLTRARAQAPRDVFILNGLGVALKQQGRLPEAKEVFEVALRLDSRFAPAHYNMGTILEEQGEIEAARAAYEQAIGFEPNHAGALTALSTLAAQRGDYETARVYGERAGGSKPGERSVAAGLAFLAWARGEYGAARAMAEVALKQNPSDELARLMLARAAFQAGQSGEAKERAQGLLDTGCADADIRANAHALIADIADRAGDTKSAFAHYETAKRESAREYAPKFAATGLTRFVERAERAAEYFSRAPAEAWRAGAGGDSAPAAPRQHVFLMGFPRSGTTLLERCLAGHPAIVSMEERDVLADLKGQYFDPPDGFERFAALGREELDRYREDYWRACRAAAGNLEDRIFIDKLPLNTVFMAGYAKLFPAAKILFALRDPRDVVFSCFHNQFAMSPAMFEFSTLEGSARLYDAAMRIAAVCRTKLTLDLCEARYENLVRDFEGNLQSICDFLGIEWHDKMRDFAARARAAVPNTPSAVQLTRGLYDGSGQWRRYAEQMAPALPILAPWVKRFGYPEI